jgi:hypothetical protein
MPMRFPAPRWHEARRRCTHCERLCRECVREIVCVHSNRWTGAKWVHCWQACSSARHLGHWPSPSGNEGRSVPQSVQRKTVLVGSIRGARAPDDLSGFPPPSFSDSRYPRWPYFLSVMPVALTCGFSLLQSGHMFHLDAEMYSCSSVIANAKPTSTGVPQCAIPLKLASNGWLGLSISRTSGA